MGGPQKALWTVRHSFSAPPHGGLASWTRAGIATLIPQVPHLLHWQSKTFLAGSYKGMWNVLGIMLAWNRADTWKKIAFYFLTFPQWALFFGFCFLAFVSCLFCLFFVNFFSLNFFKLGEHLLSETEHFKNFKYRKCVCCSLRSKSILVTVRPRNRWHLPAGEFEDNSIKGIFYKKYRQRVQYRAAPRKGEGPCQHL